MKQRIFLLLLVTFGLVAGFAIAEVAVRIIRPSGMSVIQLKDYRESERAKFTKYDSLLGWSALANIDDDFQWADIKHRVRQNKYGNRGKGYEYERSDKKRLLVLGDSFPWGFGVDDEKLFTSLMEKKKNGEIEVINTGVSGYGTDQEYLLWREKAHNWKPDHVLLMVTITNDLLDVNSSNRYGYNKPLFVLEAGKLKLTNVPVPKEQKLWDLPMVKAGFKESKALGMILEHSVLMNLFVEAATSIPSVNDWFVNRGIISIKKLSRVWDNHEYLIYMVEPNEKARLAWELFYALIEELEKSVRSFGADFTVVLIPPIHHVYPALWEDYLKNPFIPRGAELSFSAPGRRISDWCDKKKIKVIDLTPYLEGIDGTYYPINRHWTESGHEIVADALLDRLK